MAKICNVDEIPGVNIRSSLREFIAAIEAAKLERGSIFSGTIHLRDLPKGMEGAEVQGVVMYRGSSMLLDMTLTSCTYIERWTCTYGWGRTQNPQWIEWHH